MKVQYSSRYLFAFLLMLGLPLHAESVVANQRILPPGNHTGEFLGDGGQVIPAASGRLIVGSPKASRTPGGLDTGGVYVFDAATHRLVRTIFPEDGVAGGSFGWSVAVSGNVMVVGSPSWGTQLAPERGAVYLYNVSTGALLRKIEPADVNLGDRWGWAVAIEGDTVIYSARDHDGTLMGSNMGKVESFSIKNNAPHFAIQGVPLYGGRPPLHTLGASLALQRGLAVAGAPGSTSGDGAVLIFDAVTGEVVHTLMDPKGAGKAGGFGYSLGMDDDLLVVGAPFHTIMFMGLQPNAGSAYLFDTRNIVSPLAFLGSVDGGANQILGTAVATRNGVTAIGIPGTDYTPPGPGLGGPVIDYGSVMVMDHRMREIDRLSLPTLGAGARYGTTLSLGEAGHVLVGVPGDDAAGADSGSIWKAGPYRHDASGIYQIMAMTRRSALQNSAAVYADFGEVTASGLVSYTATLAGAGSSGGRNRGLWSTLQSGLAPALVAQTNVPAALGMPAHTTFLTARQIFRPICNSGLEMYFRATEAGGITALYYYDGYQTLGLSKVFDNSATTYAAFGNAAILSFGETYVPFSGTLATANLLKLRTGTGTAPVTAASDSAVSVQPAIYFREGIDNAPAPATGKYGELAPSLAYANAAAFYYRGFLQGPPASAGVFLNHNVTLALRDAAAPDATGSAPPGSPQFSSFLGVSGVHDTGRTYVLRSTLKLDVTKGVTGANNEGLYYEVNTTGLKLFARRGDIIPGTSLIWNRFLDYGITSQGHILVLAALRGPGVNASNDTALIHHIPRSPLPDATIVLVREGDILPGGEGARVSGISRVDMAFTSTASCYGALVALRNEVGGATPTNNLAWLCGNVHHNNANAPSYYLPRVAFRKGSTVSQLAGRNLITSISAHGMFRDATGAGNSGLQHAVSDSTGQPSSVMVVTLPDRSRALIRR